LKKYESLGLGLGLEIKVLVLVLVLTKKSYLQDCLKHPNEWYSVMYGKYCRAFSATGSP